VTSRIFGVRINHLASGDRLRELCERFLEEPRAHRIFTPNPEILLHAREDPDYAEVLNTADLALPDGTGLAIVESIRAGRRVRRWPGVEIAGRLLRLAAERGASVAFVGGSGDAAERAAAAWRARLPALRIVAVGGDVAFGEDGVAMGARSDDAPSRDDEVTREVAASEPAIVLVGLGAPKQERWIARHADRLPSARILMAVGGTFDMWAGAFRRAPRFVRRVGLEWAWRLALEPHRWRRIARATIVFPARALLDADRRAPFDAMAGPEPPDR
jgi:N-acetylglucosaminyldiphosphoundecaprenol N-acetyl-beta-D-mannosaminyltransferase